MSFLQANEKPDEERIPTPMPTSEGIKHDEFKDYNGVRRAPQEEKKEEVHTSPPPVDTAKKSLHLFLDSVVLILFSGFCMHHSNFITFYFALII